VANNDTRREMAIGHYKFEAIFTQPYIKGIHLVNDKIKSRNTARKYLDQLCNS
jgi:hypothetical protein